MRLKGIIELDATVSARLRLRQMAGFSYFLSALLAHSGDSWFWLLALFIVWLLGDPFWHPRMALMAAGIVILALLVFGIKLLVKRKRPDGDWGAIYRNTDPHSFPSGHAARAMMLAVVVGGTGPAWFALVLFVWMPLVSLARVVMGVHYLSDILAGLVLGVIAGLAMLSIQPLLVTIFPFAF